LRNSTTTCAPIARGQDRQLVEGAKRVLRLAFAERILPRASDLWVQALLNQRQRFQQLFFPDGIAFDGNRLEPAQAHRTSATCGKSEPEMKGLVDQTFKSWNPLVGWLRNVKALRWAA
jgi:hypothetical protein